MNKFAALHSFVTVSEQGSFTAAARKMGISASTVTKTIGRLEDELQVRLFNRTTRQLALTDLGQILFERARTILQDMTDAEALLRTTTTELQGPVRLVVPNLFGRLTLLPALAEFHRRYPKVSLQVHFGDRPVDLIESGFDIGVHTGEMADSSTIRRQLVAGPMITAAAPAYFEQHGEPAAPQDLLHHNCLHGRFGPDWEFRSATGGRQTVRISGNLQVYNGDNLREAAVLGLGVVHFSWWALRHDLASGTLREVLKPHRVPGHVISVIFPTGRHLPARVRALIDYLVEITTFEFAD